MKKLFTRALPGLALLPLALALGSCDRADVNAQTQAGAWHISSLRVQTALAPGSVQTVTDAGDVSFAAVSDDTKSGKVRFYFDKPLPVRYASAQFLSSTPLGYLADAHEQRRVVLSFESDTSPDITVVYTLTEASAQHQHWQLIGIDNEDRINYREDWDLERL